MKALLTYATILLILVAGVLRAEPTDRYEELTGEADDLEHQGGKKWKESAVKVPELPAEADWIQLHMDELPKNQQFFLGRGTVSVDDKDYVSRYWMLIRSRSGGYNASFEGTRCSTEEYIIYAYGHQEEIPQVRNVETPLWQKISRTTNFNYRRELALDYLCAGATPKSPDQIIQSVKGLYESHNPYSEYTDI